MRLFAKVARPVAFGLVVYGVTCILHAGWLLVSSLFGASDSNPATVPLTVLTGLLFAGVRAAVEFHAGMDWPGLWPVRREFKGTLQRTLRLTAAALPTLLVVFWVAVELFNLRAPAEQGLDLGTVMWSFLLMYPACVVLFYALFGADSVVRRAPAA